MTVLRIEHAIPNYDGWKKAFDNDPVGRKQSGVRRYRIYRPDDDKNFVIIDLEVENVKAAHELLASLKSLWTNVEGKLMRDPKTRILEIVDSREY